MTRNPLTPARRLGCALVIAAALSAVAPSAAQPEACPVNHACVDYQGVAIAIDPLQGPVQAIVVREEAATVKTFQGTEETHRATLAVWVSNGDTYDLQGEQTVDQAGLFAGATLGDVFVLTEVSDAD